jgi:hypothetical protein
MSSRSIRLLAVIVLMVSAGPCCSSASAKSPEATLRELVGRSDLVGLCVFATLTPTGRVDPVLGPEIYASIVVLDALKGRPGKDLRVHLYPEASVSISPKSGQMAILFLRSSTAAMALVAGERSAVPIEPDGSVHTSFIANEPTDQTAWSFIRHIRHNLPGNDSTNPAH